MIPPMAQLFGSDFGQEESYLYLGGPSAPVVGPTTKLAMPQTPRTEADSFKGFSPVGHKKRDCPQV